MKIRLPNAFGSITKLTGKRRNPYMVRKTDHIDSQTGKQVMKVLGYFPKYADAMAFLLAYNEGKVKMNGVDTPTTFEAVYEGFKEDKYDKHNKTIPYSYTGAYARCKELHQRDFNDIKLAELVKVMDDAPTPANKKNVRTLLNQMYKFALKFEYTERNLAERLDKVEFDDSDMHKPFTDEEIKKLWQLTEHFPARLWLIYIYTGVRPSELSNIEKQDVFLDKDYMIGGMKTEAGKRRPIPIAKCIKPFVEELYNKSNHYLIPAKRKDAPIVPKDLRLLLENFCENNGMQHLPHDARHTCATLLDRQNINIVLTQRILGHSSKTIAGKVYIHKDISEMIDAVNQLPTFQ